MGISVLLSTAVTDCAIVDRFHAELMVLTTERLKTVVSLGGGVVGVAALALVVVVDFIGPQTGSLTRLVAGTATQVVMTISVATHLLARSPGTQSRRDQRFV